VLGKAHEQEAARREVLARRKQDQAHQRQVGKEPLPPVMDPGGTLIAKAEAAGSGRTGAHIDSLPAHPPADVPTSGGNDAE